MDTTIDLPDTSRSHSIFDPASAVASEPTLALTTPVATPQDQAAAAIPAVHDQHQAHLPPLLSGKTRSVVMRKARSLDVRKPRSLGRLSSAPHNSHDSACLTARDVNPRAIALQTPQSGGTFRCFNMSPGRLQRVTIAVDGISPHALDRLGVNTDILKKEKGMKKLGVCGIDIERSEELRRHSGLPTMSENPTKAEIIFGFSYDQLMRVKAINVFGTTEEEVLDEYARRVSMLGTHEATIPPISQ